MSDADSIFALTPMTRHGLSVFGAEGSLRFSERTNWSLLMKELTREQWIELGRRVKLARQTLCDLRTRTEQMLGKAACRQFQQAVSKLDRDKAKLEAVARRQHPKWDNIVHVFFGPDYQQSLGVIAGNKREAHAST